MKRIDLTQLLLMVVLGIVSFWGVRQCSTRNLNEKYYQEEVSKNKELQKKIVLEISYSDSIRVLNEELAKERALLKEDNRRILASYRREKAKVEQYTSDTLYMLLKGSHDLTGALYDIDSTLLLEAELTKLERKECIELGIALKGEVEFLNRAVFEISSMNSQISEDLDDCELERVAIESELTESEREVKEGKRKIWTNRGIAGGIGLVALLILL